MRFLPKKTKNIHAGAGGEHHRRSERAHWATQNKIARHNNIIAGIGVLFSIAATGAAVTAAFFAYWAYQQTVLDVGAATTQARIMGDQENRQLRAYVYVTPASPANVIPDAPISVTFTAINDGETPAKNVSMKVVNDIFPYPITDLKWANTKNSGPANSDYIFKASTFSISATTPINISQPIIDLITDGSKFRFYVDRTVTYWDVFNQVHHTWFCDSFYGKGLTTVEPCTIPNSNGGD
jgi:hypothetical protein